MTWFNKPCQVNDGLVPFYENKYSGIDLRKGFLVLLAMEYSPYHALGHAPL